MKFQSKRELVERIEREHAAFVELLATIPVRQRRVAGVWGDGWTVADLLAHLAEWHRMLLRWVEDGRAGRTPDLPAPGFTWRETPALNREIQRRFARRSAARLEAEFEETHAQALELVQGLSEKELLAPGHFAWTRKLPLVSFIAPNTCSHYSVARKFLTRWLRATATAPKTRASVKSKPGRDARG
ncbi:MAG: ClbS/DfsB family four-helix bundle protein [Planctomycetota bacterium]|nr:ClbS/DfsB family four-helix bundle protein [Planctomycetota bacterium]